VAGHKSHRQQQGQAQDSLDLRARNHSLRIAAGPDFKGIRVLPALQRNQSDSIPEPQHSSRRDQQGAATLHKTQQGTPTRVSL
jgi:hypothetical protein